MKILVHKGNKNTGKWRELDNCLSKK